MSETPEEQPSTGVLGRIGSWFSPWKAKGPTSPTENDSPASDQACRSGEDEEREEPVRPRLGEQQRQEEEEEEEEEEKKDHSFGPNPLGLSGGSFLCEKRDATQSARRHDSAVSSTETGEGGPKEEEFAGSEGREESSHSASASGNPERNASHLTHLFSSSEQSADQAHTQTQARAGRRLHVYLEETSVIQHGQDSTQEVIRTEVTRSLQITSKPKSHISSDPGASAESRWTNVTPAAEAQSSHSAPGGGPLQSHKESELELDQEQTEADSMGRKNAARRRHRKNSQGDGPSSPQEKMPPLAEPVPEASLSSDKSVTGPQGKSPNCHMGESSESSSPLQNLPSQALPTGGENKTSCSDSDKQLDNLQDSNSDVTHTELCAADGDADMEDDESLYKVERKTETPESKRRSMKVSRSEVKLFRKHVPLKPTPSPVGDSQDYKSKLKNDKDKEKDKPKAETNARAQDPRKPTEEHKSVVGRITDKISLFERPQGVGGFKKTLQTPRSADVSPVRKGLKAIPELQFQRSKSAERRGVDESSTTSVLGEKLMTIKERMRNLTEASKSDAKTEANPALPKKQTMTGMSQKSTSSVAAAAVKLSERDRQGKLDGREQKTAKSEITTKPDGRDTTTGGVNIFFPKEEPTDSRKTEAVTGKAGDDGTKSKSVESDVSAKGKEDSLDTTGNISPQPKGPIRTGSRSKRRKSRETTSPISPKSGNKTTASETTSPISPKSGNKTTPKETTSPISPDSGNKTTPKETTSPISPDSGNKTTPKETTSPISPDSGSKSKPRETTSPISPDSGNKTTPKETTSPISPDSGSKTTARETTSPISPDSGSKSKPSETTSPISPDSGSKSKPSETTSPISPKSGNKTTPKETTSPISPDSGNKTTPKETTSPISPDSGSKSKPRETTSPISPDSGSKTTARETTSPISPDSGSKSKPSETTSPISPDSGSKSKPSETTSPISLKTKNKSTPSETTSPISPQSEHKHAHKTEQVDTTVTSAPKKITGKISSSSEKGKASEQLSEDKHKAWKKEEEVSEKLKKHLDSSVPKKSDDKPVNTQRGSPEPTLSKDEPDTSAPSSGTRTPIDKDPVISPRKQEKAGGLVFTHEREETSEGSGDNSAADQPIEKTPSTEQASPVENLWLDKDCSVHLESSGPEKDKGQQMSEQQIKNTDAIKPAESKDVDTQEKSGGIKHHHTPQKDKNETQQLQYGDESKVRASDRGVSGTEGTAAKEDETNISQGKEEGDEDRKKQEADKSHAMVATAQREKADSAAVVQTNESVSRTETDKEPLKGAIESNSASETGPVVTAAEPQPNSVSMENTKHSPNDSLTDGANDVEFHSSEANAKAPGEEVSVKASNYSPALMNVQTGNIAGKGSSAITVSEPKSIQTAGQDDRKQTVKAVPSEEKISRDAAEVVPSSSHRRTEEKAKSPAGGDAVKRTVHERTSEETSTPLLKEHPLVPNGDISPHSRLLAAKEEAGDLKPSQKAPTSPQRSPMKKLHLPRGLSKDDTTKQQDAPSSWLDVDFPKRKLKVSEPKLSSSGSESNLLDNDLDDEDFVEKIKKLCAPFSLPPRKHNHLRPPQPVFAMPAIKEDRFEKTFDPEEFKFGLRKKDKFSFETPSMLANIQKTEKKSLLKPARASLADRCLLLSSLESNKLRDKPPVKDEADGKEEKDDKVRVKSRLEGSCVLSSLTSTRGKRNGAQTPADASSSGDVSPSSPPQLSPPPPPSPTAQAPAKQSSALGGREEAEAVEAVVSDSGPPLPSFNDIKLPDYLEKFLQREPAKPVQSTQGQEGITHKVIEQMTTQVPGGETAASVKPLLPEAVPPCFPGIPAATQPALPQRPQAPPPLEKPAQHIRVAKGVHKRPGKMVLFEKPEFSGQAYEIHRDVADASSMLLSSVISVKVVRGCWLLYEKPDFQGRSIALEEGGIELANMWAEAGPETEPQNLPPMLIGSIRLAVWDYSIPHIDLFTEPEGHGRVTPYRDDTIETGSFGVPQSTASIQVHSGVWLVFSDPGFQGMLAVLEAGVYPFPEAWGFPSPFVGSLKPLRMGTFKVENPNEVKAVVFELPGFEGSFLEIDSDVFSFCEDDVDVAADASDPDTKTLTTVGSLKIVGGLWVGYSQPGFEGQQHILEEGEYLDCSEWGGSEQLLSMRPILADFLSPHLKMCSDRDFGKLGVNIDLTGPVINMDGTGYGAKTQSIDVIGGVWVVFEEPGFSGECYILEKGLYGSPEDWGGLQPRVASAMPVILDDFENTAKFKVQLYSDPGFQGSVVALEDSTASLQDGFSVASCKVVAGNWVAFDGEEFTGRMYVLEVGSYPDLRSMGCADGSSSIRSLQTVGFEFSLPSITLFERCGLRGKRVVLTDGCVNLQLAGGCSRVQSVLVEGGMWILYEGINYLGAQILLKPEEIHDWRKLSSWNKIGSLRPLLQKQVHFRVRNRHSGLMMSVTGDLEDVQLLRIQETEETGGLEQIWFHQHGHLHCKLLEECCLCPSGSMTMAGSRVGLTPEPGNQIHLWSITPEGFIHYGPSSNLVLEVKGGHNYDKNQVILSTPDANKPQQRWDVEIL